MPNAAAIYAMAKTIFEKELMPYMEHGNRLAQELYVNLPLPWTLIPAVTEFDEAAMFRKEWGPDNNEDFVISGSSAVDMDTLEDIMSTMSPVTRWREANPEAVGTEKDITRIFRREIERLLQEAGVEKGKEIYTGSLTAALLMVKKKKV
jgi:hypothetical protein